MRLRSQSGITLVETAVAAGLVAIAAGTVLYGIAMFGRFAGQQGGAARMAALLTAEQTLRIAQDAWKYGTPGDAPNGSQTISLPLSASTTQPALMTTTLSPSGASAQITVSIRYTPEPGRGDPGVVSVSGNVYAKAPLPGSQIDRPGLVAMPSGAP